MIIKRIEIERFRCVLADSLDCERMTALVGRNGAGKSCFLHALRLLYAVNPTVSNEDFYDRQTGEPIVIRVTFSHLTPEEAEAFGGYTAQGDLIITKKIFYADGKVLAKTFGVTLQHPRFVDIRAIADRRTLRATFNALVGSGELAGLENAASAPDAESKMLAWEAANPEACAPTEREAQFMGPASIGVGSLDSFTKFVYIPAVRDASEETGDGRGSALAELLELVVNERVESRPEVNALREEIRTKYAAVFAPEQQPELAGLAAEISAVLGAFHPGSAVELGWRAATPPEIGLPSVAPTLIEDGFKGEVSRKGHGLQRALVLALLQARAKSATLPPVPAPATTQAESNTAPPPVPTAALQPPQRHLIIAIEEPELYQHPQQCRHWARVLRRLTSSEAAQSEPDTQVIFSTHSPHFVDLAWFEQVRVVQKRAGRAGAPPVARTFRTTLEVIAKELAGATGKPEEQFTSRSMLARARPVMTNVVNEGFFSSVAVLVEGGTEVGILQEVWRRKSMDWDAKGIAVIDVGGKPKLSTPLAVFRALGIPVYVVFDSDAHNRDKGNQADKDERARQNRVLLKMHGATEEDFPSGGCHAKYAVVGEETSRHLKTTLGDNDYNRIADKVASDLGYDGSKAAMKNVEASALFAARVYDEGKRLALFEAIVERVTALAPANTEVIRPAAAT